MKEYADKVYDRRLSEGKVRTECRNFQTNPGKRGLGNTTTGHLFSAVKYETDAYDAFEDNERVL
jgi:hypothetical protein